MDVRRLLELFPQMQGLVVVAPVLVEMTKGSVKEQEGEGMGAMEIMRVETTGELNFVLELERKEGLRR